VVQEGAREENVQQGREMLDKSFRRLRQTSLASLKEEGLLDRPGAQLAVAIAARKSSAVGNLNSGQVEQASSLRRRARSAQTPELLVQHLPALADVLLARSFLNHCRIFSRAVDVFRS